MPEVSPPARKRRRIAWEIIALQGFAAVYLVGVIACQILLSARGWVP